MYLKEKYNNGKQVYGGIGHFKSGWHITWDDKQVFYRSSYELLFYKSLDEQKILYEVEKKRIEYFDSQTCKNRIAIVDVFLPLENKLIEIKSSFSFNEINMKDKILAYRKNGYLAEIFTYDKKLEKLLKHLAWL